MIQFTQEDFEGVVLNYKKEIPVLFYATWCPFCRDYMPRFEEYFQEQDIEYGMADISDYNDPRWDTFDIPVVPAIITFAEGEEAWRQNGVLGKGLTPMDLENARIQLAK